MSEDIVLWRQILLGVVRDLSDEPLQRRSWFGIGPEESSPDEEIAQFYGNADFERFLDRDDAGLTVGQRRVGQRLLVLIDKYVDTTSFHRNPVDVIDDPRWKEIRTVAAEFVKEMDDA
ncbi:MAG: hypothetical protein EOP22_05830 [Hyphomicrobiales bacterium]|nr:MAG: hypothetical protein EOP22_05830 [Hyphomicrobiales bacterium]